MLACHCAGLLCHAAAGLWLSPPALCQLAEASHAVDDSLTASPPLPDLRLAVRAGADALGPQDAPSLPQDARSLPLASTAAAPAPAAGGPPLQPDGRFPTYINVTYPAQPRDLIHGPRGPLEALGPGLCPSYVDQLHNTCPVPDLPQQPFAAGGPVGGDPPMIAPPTLTPAVAQMAAAMGLVVVEMNALSTGAETGLPVQAAPQAAAVAQLSASDQAVMATVTVQTTYSVNTGDSWVIRNQNCGIAPIHAILNKARPQPGLLLLFAPFGACM